LAYLLSHWYIDIFNIFLKAIMGDFKEGAMMKSTGTITKMQNMARDAPGRTLALQGPEGTIVKAQRANP
jgi:hypothetical protein